MPSPSDPPVSKLFAGFRGLRLAVVGDLIADRYVYARPTRPSREAPLVVLRQEGEEILPGGAANTARNVSSLGARVQLIGCVGRDDAGLALLKRLDRDGVSVAGVDAIDGWSTPVKTRVLAGEQDRTLQQVLRLDREPDGPAPADRRSALCKRLVGLAGEIDGLIISDYGYGMCDADLGAAIRAFRAVSHAPVVLDPRKSFKSFGPVSAMTPNREDLARILGLAGDQLGSSGPLEAAAAKVLGEGSLELLLVTLGKRGMALFGEGLPSEGVSLPAFGPQVVVDVTGAGDTAAAAFTLGLAAGLDGAGAMVLANAAAGVVVMKLGAEVCSPQELDSALGRLPDEIRARVAGSLDHV